MTSIHKLGEFIEKLDRPNSDLVYGIEDVAGITNTKQLTVGTKANLTGRTFEKFTILKPGEFIFNRRTSRNGERISLGYNQTDRDWILTEDYCHFKVREDMKAILDADYLYLYFLRPEFDRYARFNSWGSATEFFNWEEMAELPIPIIPIEEQYKIVNNYKVVTDRIDLLKKINENLEAQAQCIFAERFVKTADNAWETKHFDSLILQTIPGDWGSESPEKNNTACVTCFRGADMPYLNIGITGEAPTRYILPKNYETKCLSADNFIVEISGGSPTQSTGRISMLTKEIVDKCDNAVICSNFCKGVCVRKEYIYFFFLMWKFLYRNKKMFDYENGTTGLKNFDFDTFVSSEKILIPPVDIAESLNELIKPLHDSIIRNGFEIEQLDMLSKTMLPHLMNGGC